ncbi:MAG: NAD-dependent epimerase/dehydratase family protein [Chitinophagia bacterium]|nr:NAD-dependent epimerase/dehydratase family protein [Chitinophagia bacterium]
MQLFGNLPADDLEELCNKSLDLIKKLEYVNFVVVGASGFLGRWLSTFLAFMGSNSSFKGSITIIVRDLHSMSELNSVSELKTFRIIETSQIEAEEYSHFTDARTIIVFAATSTKLSGIPLTQPNNSATNLAQRIIDSLPKRNITFVHLSSGGIYHPMARQLQKIPSNFRIQQNSQDQYIYEKIKIEEWSEQAEESGLLTARNPRLFSFYGPGLDLDRHYAIGEFMRLGKSRNTIVIKGRPDNLRSYLYPTDAIFQLLLQCSVEVPQFSQIGSAHAVSILETALIIGEFYNVKVEVDLAHSRNIDNYVPSDVHLVQERNLIAGIMQWERWLSRRIN